MVQLRLPSGSRVLNGRTWNEPRGPGWRELRIYRWSPEEGGNPKLDSYWIDPDDCGPMVLDALHKIRWEIDPTLAFRRSCREGICGSCSMNIDGGNALACLSTFRDGHRAMTIYPLPHMHIIRDLVPDLSKFFEHYHAMEPHLRAAATHDGREHRQSPAERHRLDGLYECILCACCSAACPSYWWNEDSFPGPAALLQSHRWVTDSRDATQEQRLDDVTAGKGGVWGCRQILNCAKVCPKGLNPAKAIAELRRLEMGRRRRSPLP
jgi:succinate dehydrogenase / fumarate reductase iron-sulfur subunit